MLRKSLPLINRLFALALCALLSACAAYAQSQATSGNIEGRVLDPNNAAIPNATVTARNNQTGLERTAMTDDEGIYRLVLLPPGTYSVTVHATNFADLTEPDVTVTVGGKTTFDAKVNVGGISGATVNVSAESTVETTRTSVSTTVNERAIENLPVNGRNYLDFATLTPGVIRDPTRQGDLSVGGQKGTLNNLQVDGVDNNNTFFGQAFGRTGVRPPYQFSEESVQEFQVNQNGFSAEFGRAGGAVINVVTKSGTNDFHGGAFEYFRDESLNANPPATKANQATRGLPNRRVPQQINQFGARMGGPIVRNRAFFFFTYDGQRQKLSNPVEPPNFSIQSSAIQSLLLPKLATYPINRNQDVFMGKGDIILNRSNQLSLRFNRQNFTGVNNENNGALSAAEHSGNSLAHTTTFSGTLASTITPRLINEFRFQFARDAEPGMANSDLPEARIGTVATGTTTTFFNIGRNNFSPRETTIRRAQVIDNVLYTTGRHNIKTGFDFNFDRILNFFPGFFNGQYTFNNYTDFLNNNPSAYQQAFAGTGTTGATTHPDISDYALFVQDDWRFTPKLTLNLGVRYDLEKLAAPPVSNTAAALVAAGIDTGTKPSDANNIAPRVGFSYAFSEKSVVRGGYGLFYGRTTGIMLGTAHSQNGINVINLTFNKAQMTAAGLVYPNILSARPTTGANASPISLYLFAKDYEQPYVQQGRLAYEREISPKLSPNTTLSVTYLFYKGVHLSRTRDINLPTPGTTAFLDPVTNQTFQVPVFNLTARPVTGFSRINLFESSGNSLYNALAVQVQRRFSKGWQFLLSYTLSKSKDDKPDQTSVVPGNAGDDVKIVSNQQNIRLDYGTSDVDIPHRFVFSSVREFGTFKRSNNSILRALLSDYILSSITQINSGVPYSATFAGDLNGDGNAFNDRAPGTERNQFRTRTFWQSDMRITRIIRLGETVRLRLIGEGFNMTNRTNIASTNINLYNGSIAGSPRVFTRPTGALAFGLPRTFFPAREFQLAIKLDF